MLEGQPGPNFTMDTSSTSYDHIGKQQQQHDNTDCDTFAGQDLMVPISDEIDITRQKLNWEDSGIVRSPECKHYNSYSHEDSTPELEVVSVASASSHLLVVSTPSLLNPLPTLLIPSRGV